MIDENVLGDLLREASEAIALPPDGPRRILDAREVAGPQRARRRLRVRRGPALGVVVAIGAVASLVVAVASLQGTGAGKAGTSSGPRVASPALTPAGAPTSVAGSAAAGGGAAHGAAPGGAPGSSGIQVQPLVIKTGSVTLQVPDGQVGATANHLTSLAAGLGGYVASTATATPAGQPATADVTLRVPAARFEELLNEVRDLGTPTDVTTSGQDVTSQYVDLKARITSLEDTRAQYRQILAKATTIGDILAVEQQINTVQTQLEELQGQLQVMNDQTGYGTLAVHVTEPARKAGASAASGFSGAWAHARHAFAHGIEALVAWSGGFAVFLVVAMVLGLIARLAWNALRRRLV